MTKLQKFLYALSGLALIYFVSILTVQGVTPTRQEFGGTGTSTIFTTNSILLQGANGYRGSQAFFLQGTSALGINSSSPAATLSVVGTSTNPTLDLLNIASSSGVSVFKVSPAGAATLTGALPLSPTDYLLKVSSSTGGTLLGIQANAAITLNTVSYTFPLAQGSANQVLQNDGTGILSWATAASASGTSTFVTVCSSGCDYTATTTGAQVGINAAMAAVSSAGRGTVYVRGRASSSPYTISDRLEIPSNVTLMGDGPGKTIIKAQTNYNPTVNSAGGFSIMVNFGQAASNTSGPISNVDIHGITFDANGPNIASASTTQTSINRAIYIKNATNIKFYDNEILNSLSWSTDFDQNDQLWVERNRVVTGWSNTLNQQDGLHISDSKNFHINNNYVDTIDGGTSGDDAIAVQQFSPTFPIQNGEVEGNVVNGAGSRGIALVANAEDFNDVVVSGNTIKDTFNSGLSMSVANGTAGVYHNVTLSNNVIDNSGTGHGGDSDPIRLERDFGGARTLYQNINISGNIMASDTYASSIGIDIFGKGNNFVIANNQISNISGTDGILLGSSGNPVTDYIINSNQLKLGTAASGVKGIHLYDTTRGEVTNNQINGHTTGTTYGVYIEGATASAYNDVSHNNIYNVVDGIAEINSGVNPTNDQFIGNVFDTVTTNLTLLGTTGAALNVASSAGINQYQIYGQGPTSFQGLKIINATTTAGTSAALAFNVSTSDLTTNPTAEIRGLRPSTGNGNLLFMTNNAGLLTEGMRVTNLGLIGIGTTTPLATLHVQSLTGTSTPAFIISTSTGPTLLIVNAAGNVGIGTSNPLSLLTVAASPSVQQTYLRLEGNGAFSGSEPSIDFTNTAGNVTSARISSAPGSAFAASYLEFSTANSSMALTERARIDTSGNFGIATSSPSQKLDVWGNVNVATGSVPALFVKSSTNQVGIGTNAPSFGLDINTTNTSGLRVFNSTGSGSSGGGGLQVQTSTTTTDSRLGFVLFGSNGTNSAELSAFSDNQWTLGSDQPSYLSFKTTPPNSVTRTERVRITSSGRVGIGTTTPGYGLVVATTTQLTGLTTSGSAQTANLCLNSSNEVISDTVSCIVSGLRFKQQINPLNVGLAEVMKLSPVAYHYKPEFNGPLQDNPNYNGEQVGLIADEVQKIDPRLVTVETATSTNGSITSVPGQVASVRYENLTAVLIKAIQDQQAEIEQLKTPAPQSNNYLVEILGLFIVCGLVLVIAKTK